MIKINLDQSMYIGFDRQKEIALSEVDCSKVYIKITMNMDAKNEEIQLKISMKDYCDYKEILEALKVEFAGQKFSIIFK